MSKGTQTNTTAATTPQPADNLEPLVRLKKPRKTTDNLMIRRTKNGVLIKLSFSDQE